MILSFSPFVFHMVQSKNKPIWSILSVIWSLFRLWVYWYTHSKVFIYCFKVSAYQKTPLFAGMYLIPWRRMFLTSLLITTPVPSKCQSWTGEAIWWLSCSFGVWGSSMPPCNFLANIKSELKLKKWICSCIKLFLKAP